VGVDGSEHSIIFYDGECGLCNRFVQFVLKHDYGGLFRFAALQRDTARHLLEPYRVDLSNLSTICVIADPGASSEKFFTQSDAVIEILGRLGISWWVVSFVLRIIPRGLRDWGYRFVARHRYQIFGKYDSCPIPDPKDAHRFLA
jgi:predicted DCC family thiol-disulfide oxidoreductase YuxK